MTLATALIVTAVVDLIQGAIAAHIIATQGCKHSGPASVCALDPALDYQPARMRKPIAARPV